MCVIVICPEGVRPEPSVIRACYDHNPHGAGVSWREGDEVRWVKTNSVEEVIELSASKTGEIVMHFRIASVGSVCNALRHPFPVSKRAGLADEGSAKAVLFQNGTWMSYRGYLEAAQANGFEIPRGKMSDARAAAFLVSIYGKKFLENCRGSRWVHYSIGSTTLFGDWHRWRGMLFSNMYWKRSAIELVVPKDEEFERRRKPVKVRSEALENFKRRHHDEEIDMPIPDDVDCKPCGTTPKRSQEELELWDMSAANSYWERLARSCPKPTRKH